ncbi:MAG: glycerol-3-phosphate acyltransferase [Clostridia bacterium]|nr:glycerol-3-phosphate acyltransferase [Clostridia bacterium]
MERIVYHILFAAAGFLSGSVMFAYLIPKIFKKKDIVKDSRDGNPGTYNAVKLAGWPVGLTCLLFELLKGFLPVFLAAAFLGINDLWFAGVLAAPVLGHALAPYNRFKGGKCVAVSFGVLLGLIPYDWSAFLLAFIYIFFSVALKINPHERRSSVTFAVFEAALIVLMFFTGHFAVALGGGLITAVAILRNGVKAAAPDEEALASETDAKGD